MDIKRFYLLILVIFHFNKINLAVDDIDIFILVINQNTNYNSKLAINLEENILEQLRNLNQKAQLIYFTQKHFPHVGDWTVLPILPKILEEHTFHWLFVCNELTNVNVTNLFNTLNKYNHKEYKWIGHALFDEEPTIIHHFAFPQNSTAFYYPNFASGFVISYPLVVKLSNKLYNSNSGVEFSIDASHELALFIWDESSGEKLIHEDKFCIQNDENCATYVKNFIPCDEIISNDGIYFAVKTYHEFHNNRLKTVKNTWAKYIENVYYFSNVEDKTIPTISVNISNTEYGHCAKTFAIIKYFYNINKDKNYKFLIIVDDDTILSSSRLKKYLTCFANEKYLALGERYGYKTQNVHQPGYNYITGGGGIVLNEKLVELIINNPEDCSCPRTDTPDDMFLGICLARLGVSVTHSKYFHQARPNDYSQQYLSQTDDISFHKHWMLDPIQIYQQFFEKDDQNMFSTEHNIKSEL